LEFQEASAAYYKMLEDKKRLNFLEEKYLEFKSKRAFSLVLS
jgi:hypothetical protein